MDKQIILLKRVWKTGLIALTALSILIGGLLLASSGAWATGSCVNLDFSGLRHGEKITLNYYSANGIVINGDVNGLQRDLIAFNSDSNGTPDPDLEVGIGNLLILPEDRTDMDGDGIVDVPNDSSDGGTQIYKFNSPRTVKSFTIVDIDRGSGHSATAFDENGDVIKSFDIPVGGDGNIQTINVDASGVWKFEIDYADSAGVTNVVVCKDDIPSPIPTPSAAPSPAVGGTVINNINNNSNTSESNNENKVEVKVENNAAQTVNVTSPAVIGAATSSAIPVKQPETGAGVLGIATLATTAPIGYMLSRYGRGRVLRVASDEKLGELAYGLVEKRSEKDLA